MIGETNVDNSLDNDNRPELDNDENSNNTNNYGKYLNYSINILKSSKSYLTNVSNQKSIANQFRKELTNAINPIEFSKPKTLDEAISRIKTNTTAFKYFYTVLSCFVLLIYVLSSPTMFISLGIVLGLIYLFFFVRDPDEVLKIGTIEIGKKEKLFVLGPILFIIVVFGGLISLVLTVLMISMAIIIGHASIHNPHVEEIDPLDEFEQSEQLNDPIGDQV